MRILHVVNIYFSLSYFGDQFKYFSEKGYKQHLICSPAEQLRDYSIKQGINFEEVRISRKITLFSDIYAIFKISRSLLNNNIDIVVGHTPKGALIAMISAFAMRVPKRIYFRHGLVYETMGGFNRKLMINLDRLTALCATQVVCVSPSLAKQSIADRLNPARKQLVLGNGTCGGIDAIGKFNPALIDNNYLLKLRESLKISDNSLVIGYCGRLVRDKGIIDLVESFSLLKTKMPEKDIKLLLVGDFEERDALPLIIQEEINNNPDIICTGFVFNSIENYYALMNVFILPSYREGFGMVTIEAAAMELPVLTTKITGCIDAIQEGKTGFFITNEPQEIAVRIENLFNDPNFKQYGINGRNMVLRYFENNVIWPIIESKLYSN